MAEIPSDPFTILFLEPFQKIFWNTSHGLLFFSAYVGENLKEQEKTKKLWFVQHYKIILKSDSERVGDGKRGSPLAAVCPHAWLRFAHPPVPLEALAFARPSPGISSLLHWVFAVSASPYTHLVDAFSVVTPKKVQGSKRAWSVSLLLLGVQVPQK